jgi:molybdate transport system ATP-binding protein
VTIRRGERLVFPHTTWCMRTDERWAIIGPNGSGKSTLAQALSGALPVVRGEIIYHFGNQDPQGYGPVPEEAIAHISFEMQREVLGSVSAYQQARWNSALDGDALTVVEFLTSDGLDRIAPHLVGPRPVPAPGFQTRLHNTVRLFGIGYLLDRRVAHLSNGETRKVLMARALAHEPRLLILDDPFGGLDPQSREVVNRILRRVLRHGTPVLLVATRAEDIPPPVTHVLRVANGRVVARGTRQEILARPAPAARPRMWRVGRGTTQRAASGANGTPATPLVRMRKVGVAYGSVRILTDVTWHILPGQRWTLMGPNGAGKSTLLSLILGDNPQAYANDIELFGRRRGSGESIWEIKRHIGYLSPEMLVHYREDLSCGQVVCSGFFDSIGLYNSCSRAQRQAARLWLERLGIGTLARRGFLDVSDGLQRVVLLARALVKDPPLLILDEPCQGLDPEHREVIRGLLDHVCTATSRAMIYVTHRRDELPTCITHELQLRRGRVVKRSSCGTQSWSANLDR